MANNALLRWVEICPICGEHYTRTNFMTRRDPEYKGRGIAKTNTHILACRRKQLSAAPTETPKED